MRLNQKRFRLSVLIRGIAQISTKDDVEVTGMALDSREVKSGDVFFAYPGAHYDGRDYIQLAIDQGAVAVIHEAGEAINPTAGVVCYPVQNLRHNVGVIANRFFGYPSEKLFVIGITGTNGKTTCTHLLTQAFQHLGVRCGLIGTLGIGFLEDISPTVNTTPDPIRLHRELRRFLDDGASHVCMEVSSHALDQGRVAGVAFDAAVFTNLSHEHLDYHQDMAAYKNSKAQLFECASLQFAVLNQDDSFSNTIRTRCKAQRIWYYGLRDGDVFPESVTPDEEGLTMVVNAAKQVFTVRSSLIGRVNAVNLLVVATLLLASGRDSGNVASVIQRLKPVPGRMELFRTFDKFPRVVVDYAHTPDALVHALRSLREHCTGRLWCVFGCGGDRDRVKRPMMGRIAEELADIVILTDDNPRFETPQNIVSEIASGMHTTATVIHDRTQAIQRAIRSADPSDWVLVAGKGHETAQQVGHQRLPLSDRSVVSQTLGMAA